MTVLFFSLRDQIESVELISIKIVDSIMPVGIRILVLMPAGFFTLILQIRRERSYISLDFA